MIYCFRIKDDSVSITLWPQHDNKRLKRNEGDDEGSGSGMDTSVIVSTLLIPMSSSIVPSESVTVMTSTFSTFDMEGSGDFSTILSSSSEITPFTSIPPSPISPLPTPQTISSPVDTETSTISLQTTEVSISSAMINLTTSNIDVTPSFSSTVLSVSTSSSFSSTPSTVRNSTSNMLSTIEMTPIFSSSVTTSMILSSNITPMLSTIETTPTPSFTMTMTDTIISSSINITSAASEITTQSSSSTFVAPSETIVSMVSTSSATMSTFIVPTMMTTGSVSELTSITPLPTPSVLSSTTSVESIAPTAPLTVSPTTPSSEFLSPSFATTFSIIGISSMLSSPETAVTTSLFMIPSTNINGFTSTTFVSPADTATISLSTVVFTSDTDEPTPTIIPSLPSSFIDTMTSSVPSTTEIVTTMITSVITSEILSSSLVTLNTVDVASSFEVTLISSIEISSAITGSLSTSFTVDLTSSFESTVATMTINTEVPSPSSLMRTSEIDSVMTFSSTLPTMISSSINNITSEIPSPSSLLPASETDFFASMISSTTSSTGLFLTMTSSNIITTDFTSTSPFTFSSEVDMSMTFIPQPSSIASVSTNGVVPSSSVIIETMAPSSIITLSSFLPASETDFITSMISSTTSSPGLFSTMTFSTMTSSNIITTDFTSTSPFTFSSEVDMSMTFIPQPSSIASVSTNGVVPSSSVIIETMAPSSIITLSSFLPASETDFITSMISSTTSSPGLFSTMTSSNIITTDFTSTSPFTFSSEVDMSMTFIPQPSSIASVSTNGVVPSSSVIIETMAPSSIITLSSFLPASETDFITSMISSTTSSPGLFSTMTSSNIITTDFTSTSPFTFSSEVDMSMTFIPQPSSIASVSTNGVVPSSSVIIETMAPSSIITLSSFLPASETDFITSMISSTTSSPGLFSTMTSSNIITTDFTSTSPFTFSSEVDMSMTFIPQPSSIASVSTNGVVPSSSVIIETMAPSSVVTLSTVESTQPTSVSSFLTSSTEILSTVISESIIESSITMTESSSTFLTSSLILDTTATVASSVAVSPTITPTPVMPSDSINVTTSTISSFSQPLTSISTPSTTSIRPSPSSEFITSDIISITELPPTQTPIVSSEVTPSATLIFTEPSSPMVSVSSFITTSNSALTIPTTTASPTPTMLQCSPGNKLCEILMTCIPTAQECPNVPRAPIAVLVERSGFLIDEIKQDENKTNQYTFRFVNFINAFSKGAIVSKLGSLKESETFVSPPQINYSSLGGHILQNKIAPNDTINIVIQAHNLSVLSTSRESFPVVITSNDTNIRDECTITVNSGYCIASLNGFNSQSTVSISIMDSQRRVSLEPVVKIIKIAEGSNVNGPAILMKLPTHTIYPPDDVIITISSINYLVKSLLMNCTVNDSDASITALPINNWSTLFINNNIQNQLVISHERVMEASDEDVEEEEILTMKIHFKDYKTDQIEVQCQLEELLLTNRVLVDIKDSNIRVLDRSSVKNSSGYIFLANDSVAYLVAYSNQTVVFNTAVINGKKLTYDLVAEGITVTGRVENLTNLHCNSSNSSVLKVTLDCSEVFLDGTEITGSESVAINVYYESLNTVVLFRVWHPKMLILEAEDLVLNAISNWHDPHLNCSSRYQQTAFRVFANVTDGAMTKYRVDVTSIVSEILRSSDESVIRVFPNATVQGVSPGIATVIANNIGLIEFNVSNETVKAAALEVMLYNKLKVTIPQTINLYNEASGTVILTQENDRPKVIFVNLLFTDSQRMELKRSDYVVDITCSNNIVLRNNLIHPIGNTNESKECIRVTLIRDEACNVNNSVEGVANVSVQLSTADYLEIKMSSHEIITDKNISVITGISTEITLQAILYFRNGDQIDITLSNETNITTPLNITRSLENLIFSASSNHMDNEYTITVTNLLYNASNSTTVNVVQDIAINLSIHPYPVYNNSERTSITHLSRIGNTEKYQQGLLKVMLTLPDRNYNITANASFIMFPNDMLMLSSGTVSTVTVNNNIMAPTNVSITAQFSSLLSNNVTIQVISEPVELVNIDISFVPEFTGVQNSTMYVNASVTLSDNTTIPNIYNGNISLYPGLLNFSVSDITTASIEGNTVKLLGNSLTDNYITANYTTANGQDNLNATSEKFRCNLEAGLHDLDLGNDLNLPITVNTGRELKIPVHVNSENTSLGIFEMNVMYPSKELEVVDVVPGEDWVTGSLAYQIATIDEDIDMVTFGGINYQSTKGKSIHVANITFKANSGGNVILNSTILLLAEADFESNLLADRNRNSMAGSLLTIDINENRKRRDISYDEPPLMSPETEINHHHHQKRQSNESTQALAGDANLDGIVDLRDVNYLRHYQVESVYNFTSSNGMIIQSQTSGMLSSLDVNGDGQINSLDTIELENINFDLLRVIENISALCSYDNRTCTCTITGELYTNDMQPSPLHDVFILVDFGSTNQSFQNEFNNTYFDNGNRVSYHNIEGLYGGMVLAEIKTYSNRTVFVVKTNSSFNTPNIGISLVQVTIDANNQTSDDRKSVHVTSGSSYPALNLSLSIPKISEEISITLDNGYSPFRNLSNDCPMATTAIILNTMSISNLVTTTVVNSTLGTLSPTSTVAMTTPFEVPTSTAMVVSSSLTAEQPTSISSSIASLSSVQPTPTTVAVSSSVIATSSEQLRSSSTATTSVQPTPTTMTSNNLMTEQLTSTTMTSSSPTDEQLTPTTVVSSTAAAQPMPTTTVSSSSIAKSSEQTTSTINIVPSSFKTTSSVTTTGNIASTSTTTTVTSTVTTTGNTASTSTTGNIASTSTTTLKSTVTTTGNTASTSTTGNTASTSTTGDTQTSSGSGGGSSIGAIVAVVVILVVIVTVVVVVIVGCWYRRSKRRKSYYFKPNSRPSSGLSSNYWFQEEEKIVSFYY